jgi:HD-like signal output (HDOD) protein
MLTSAKDQVQVVDDFLARLNKLHSVPMVALRVMELTQEPDFEMADVTGCLEHDPALAASVLRLVNSSYYGLSQQVTSLQHAIAYLGRRSLRLTVLSFGLVKTLVSGAPAQFHQAYWKRSLTMAAAARKVSRLAGNCQVDAETAFSAGLLADLGMLVMAQLETTKYVDLSEEPDHMIQLIEQEHKIMGFDHRTVSQRLLTKWKLPSELIEAVANHHTYLPSASALSQVLLAANLLAEVLWMPGSPYMQPLRLVLGNQFGMDLDDLITLAVESKEAVNKSMEIFDIQLEGHIDLEAVEQQAREQFELAALDTAADLDCVESFADTM